MISLDIENYCHNCSEFEPDCKTIIYMADGKIIVDTLVTCEHKDRCRNIKTYIEQQLARKEK